MAKTVLITGGTGVIGRRLTQLLLQQGFQVSLLSRSAADKNLPNVTVYQWNVEKGHIDPKAILTAHHVIHLAGAGIAEQRWTDERKQLIIESRTKSTQLLVNALRSTRHNVESFVAASAIGYYGGDTGDRPLTETSEGGTDFMAQVVRAWERSAEEVASLGIRMVKLRIGIVLSMEGGALPKLVQPARLGLGSPLGSGQQYLSWIHVDDLCRMFIQALTDKEWQGVYNAVAPEPVTNSTFVSLIIRQLRKPSFLPKVPGFAVRLLFGEMAIVVLGGNYVLNKRIQEEGRFSYKFTGLSDALADLLGR
ncbi:TIGR01777 family oxidoreductase [Larkinella insperata]|uniref:TIGR01777 family oxidoreductase n=1 Tax=Larkinella insperata TaxID=332158 RepID=A0ABW3QIE4_9BACT|nr:TIGR01777 family oxidoreductase [Larkinella insperata]